MNLTHRSIYAALSAALLAPATWAANHAVAVGGQFMQFTPSTLTINRGDTVTFTNQGGAHNVFADNGAFRCAAGCDDVGGGSGNISSAPWSFVLTFNTSGTFGYFCEAHGFPGGGMKGSITVQGTTPPPPPPPPPNLGPGYTGAWYNPAQDGHGFFLEVLPGDRFLAAWFVFSPEGQQSWIVGSGTVASNTATVEGVLATGGRFVPNFDPAQIVRNPWGRMTFTFTDCNNGRMDYVSTFAGYGSGTVPLARLTLPAGSACATPAEATNAH
ncbi:MAG: plastocyanin/azurin family copper-binding protein [Lysobacterales bacterium]